MKKILLATTMIVGTAGFASAEITFSGSAVMGVGDNGGVDGARSIMETYLTANAASETDTGLSFGFSTTIATYSTDGGLNDDGTSAFISGAFGKLSMGSVSEADEVATLSDIGGLSGLGVDNVAERYTGDSNGRQSHDVNYTYSGGPLTLGASTQIGAAGEGDAYAVGAKYTFGDAYVGLGYNDDNSTPVVAGTVASVYAGGKFGAIGVNAMWSEWNPDAAGANQDAYGVYMTYSMDALTVMAEYADGSAATDAAYGIGASYDLGGGASVVGGVANVSNTTVWEAGVSMSF
ncbi:MAG: porin [Tabrizicola sp.]|uniref:porin n=1 Tax=Tabrizicola sp. TaxID=2005166 RepID=UPI002732C6F2|nr:porin [Tabrizicola sp.]MDP3262295.1 porin [Tabrizicola sp.]MDP3647958.1 porin [Paracoccaceae bacterium]MDZ4066558.1 porin [Tabrizicola sp.]